VWFVDVRYTDGYIRRMSKKNDHRFGGISEALADRNFRIYSVGSIGSWISFFVQLVAVAWLTWEITGSTSWLAGMALLDIVPNVVLMPLAGAFADRHDRHTILITTSGLLLIQAVAMAVLAWLSMLTIWPLAGLVLVHGILISFLVPAMYGTLPRFVGRAALSSAIAVSSAYTQFAVFVGPVIAGWIISNHGITMAFVVNALGYVALIIALMLLKTPPEYQRPTPSPRSIVGDIINGFSYIRNDETITWLLGILLVSNALSGGFIHMLPAYSDLILGLGVIGVSTILASRGIGATAAALWLAYSGAKAARIEWVQWASLTAILALVVLINTENIILASAIVGVMGFAGETRKTATMSIIQLSVEESQRGRIMGTLFMLSQLAAGIGVYLIGTLAAKFGLQPPFIVGVAIGVVIWMVLYVRRLTSIVKP
jgi:MFS family permease